jgi:hypothetical protein
VVASRDKVGYRRGAHFLRFGDQGPSIYL